MDLLAPTRINITNIEETKIKIDLDVGNFRDDYGKIRKVENYWLLENVGN